MTNYIKITKANLILPKGEPIYSEMTTSIEIEDESGGCFVVVRQFASEKSGRISIDEDDWPSIRDAIDETIALCKQLNSTT